MKVIFLDFDGVLNHESFYKQRKITKASWPDNKFCFESIKQLNRITDSIVDAKIVISSTWRHHSEKYGGVIEMCKTMRITGEVIGITPFHTIKSNTGYTRSAPRGTEVEEWLNKKGFYHINWSVKEQKKYIDASGIENYIIIDDDSDFLLCQKPHFIHILPSPRHKKGLDKNYADKAIEILNKNLIDLHY